MKALIEKQLEESLRDALLGLYLSLINSDVSNSGDIKTQLKTANDLYHHLLLDVLVSQDVPTSPVACAIASLQQYINSILDSMEQGYHTAVVAPDQIETWRTAMHEYQGWATNERLHYFPAAYLDPTLRQNCTESFKKLENDLNQNQLSIESVQTTVLAYLSRLEEVANLKTVNGYIDGSVFSASTYYFVARSRTANTWYWRSLDMTKRPSVPESLTSQYDAPEPQAWSDWNRFDLPFSESAIEHTVRPVMFNKRLYVIWAECIFQDKASSNSDPAKPKTNPLFRLNMCFKKYDGSWSTPTSCVQAYGLHTEMHTLSVEQVLKGTQTIAVYDQNDACLLVALYVTDVPYVKKAAKHLLWMSAQIDKDAISRSDIRASGLLEADTDVPLRNLAEHFPPGEQRQLQFLHEALQNERTAPSINTHFDGKTGTTEFIDFAGSEIEFTESGSTVTEKQKRSPIRMNITFARHLIERAEASMDELLSWSSQHLPEPPFEAGGDAGVMDFHGAYGRYFFELFLYLPWLVAHRFNQERQYAHAENWLQYLFNPGRKKIAGGSPDYWNSVPLTSSTPAPGQLSHAIQGPQDPHQIALSHPVHFRKALYMLHIDILLNRADAAYRRLTPDGLSQAKLWYVRAADLLGPRPDIRQTDIWNAITLGDFSSEINADLRSFEKKLSTENKDISAQENLAPEVCVRPYAHPPSIHTIDTPHLRLPFNPVLIAHWDRLESRLHNLRHNLDIVGRPLNPPIFGSTSDSGDPLSTNPPKAAEPGNVQRSGLVIPPYRFRAMHAQAMTAVESVIQFGATLLSFIERSEQASYLELQQHHVWDIANMAVELQTHSLTIDRKSREALLAGRAILEGRRDYYGKLVDEVLNPEEVGAAVAHLTGRIAEAGAHAAQAVGHGLKLVPNIFGLADGGFRLEGGPMAVAAAAMGAATAAHGTGEALERAAQYRRRHQEWIFARDQVTLEIAQIDAQLALEAEKEAASQLLLRQTRTALNQARNAYNFLSKRFTNSQLYQWFTNQLSSFYYQVYDSTLALCRLTEQCWRYELADDSTPPFFEHLAWNTTYRGLGPGERMKLGLLKMNDAYLLCHDRELEIRKTVSLRRLKQKEDDLPGGAKSINKPWDDIVPGDGGNPAMQGIKFELVNNGSCEFELSQSLFDHDYPGHCLRRIKSISVSLPAIVGPYEDIRATLTQTASEVVLPGDGKTVLKQARLNQQIALSTGVDDSGLFMLNFQDERFLPFEYTGAVSKWKLSFPNHRSQKAMLESLTDVIVHLRYTARVGGLTP